MQDNKRKETLYIILYTLGFLFYFLTNVGFLTHANLWWDGHPLRRILRVTA